MEWERTTVALVGERVENGMGENNCGTGWGEGRECNGRECSCVIKLLGKFANLQLMIEKMSKKAYNHYN